MNVVVLKVILIVVMGLVAFICGTLPIKLYGILQRRSKKHGEGYSSLIISLLSCFAGGVILGVCLLDMLPDAQKDLVDLEKDTGWKFGYPVLELCIGIGFFFVYFLEEVIDKLCDHGHENTRQRRMTVAVLPPTSNDESIHHASDLSVISCEDPQKLMDYSSTASDQPFGFRTETICIKDSEAESKRENRKALVSALTF
uniref:Zinc transporter ZIP1 n=1 Tax=Panagrolaimus sp. ES5 TaxID=591445 RepID=A0AC34GP78_9BILA